MEEQNKWKKVDDYFTDRLNLTDSQLDEVLKNNADSGLPPIDVSRTQAKMLQLLIKLQGARRVLEFGTLGGYSSIAMAEGLPEDGHVVSLEASEKHADVARSNIQKAGLSHKITVRVGSALETLPTLSSEPPFDFIFIDADKKNNPAYVEWSLKLGKPGACLVVDNVVRGGEVLDDQSSDENIQGIRKMFDYIHDHPKIDATAIQTVGSKEYDGFLLAIIK
ncbi:O-methyltransferase [Halobacillus yeomjeoni]|uniref:O-methyltransferase n=1 Tax=Halobacillus yeomjeoni TaxID=311194 RepID=A0A931HXE1_9BACI|nr:O-methyltransferase [Halobacillus yeomjeoni]MBH0231243.1 O-methyltransferase [Halobacillus yeomjeoni]